MKRDAIRSAKLLLTHCKVGALGTLHEGAPGVSMVPYAIAPDPFAVLLLVSSLSAHTRDMLAEPRVAFMVMEPENTVTLSHELARVAFRGTARALERDSAEFAAARAVYAARFPDMTLLFELGDFTLFAIEPTSARVVLGFAQAFSIEPASLAGAADQDTAA